MLLGYLVEVGEGIKIAHLSEPSEAMDCPFLLPTAADSAALSKAAPAAATGQAGPFVGKLDLLRCGGIAPAATSTR
jgi:hypothetical protein